MTTTASVAKPTDPNSISNVSYEDLETEKTFDNRGRSKASSFLVVSPYTSGPHLLDLTSYDQATQLFAKALTAFRPTREDYATADYQDSFNFDEVFIILRQLAKAENHMWQRREFYVVSFRSQLKPVVDSDRLFDLDAYSHQEAIESGGLLKYWYGIKNEKFQNLATCFWESRQHAQDGGRGQWHAQARAATGIWYDSIVFKRHTLTIEEDVQSWHLSDFDERHPRA